jgi:hypothetical protein
MVTRSTARAKGSYVENYDDSHLDNYLNGIGKIGKWSLATHEALEHAILNNPYEVYAAVSQKLLKEPKSSLISRKELLRNAGTTERMHRAKIVDTARNNAWAVIFEAAGAGKSTSDIKKVVVAAADRRRDYDLQKEFDTWTGADGLPVTSEVDTWEVWDGRKKRWVADSR